MHWMKCGWSVALVLVACSSTSVDQTGASDSATDSANGSTGGPNGPSGDDATAGGTQGSNSDSLTGDVPTGATSLQDTEVGTTMEIVEGSSTGMTGMTSVSSTSMGGETDTGVVDTSSEGGTTVDPMMGTGTTDPADTGTTEPDGTSTTDPGCVPVQEVCNDLDDDCDNIIDDVDEGMDGICDCLSIALVGNQGANNSSQFQTWLQDQGTTVERINSVVLNDINAPITPAVLAKYDIVILDWLQRNYAAQESMDVRAWIEGGGGLMTMTGHTNNQVTIDRSNSFISPLGLTYNGSQGFFSGPVTQFAPHPITMGLTSISFYGGLYVDIVNDGVGMNQTIMTLPQGPVGVVQERLMGRVFVFGDEWIEFDSEWQNMPEIQQFWVQTLAWLGPQNSCIVPQ